MMYKKIVFVLLICFLMGCSDMALLEKPEPIREDDHLTSSTSREGSLASTQTVAIQTVPLSTLQSGTSTTLNSLRSSPATYEFTNPDGSKYARFTNIPGLPAFNYQNGLKVLKPGVFTAMTWDEIRAELVTNLNKFHTNSVSPSSTAFDTQLLVWFDFMRTLDTKTFAQFEAHIEGALSNISNPPFGVSKLTEKEKFALTQAYYAILNQAKWVYNNPRPSAGGSAPDCIQNRTKEEWKEVAETAFTTGVMSGGTLGWVWAQAGAAATTPSGSPGVGLVTGGILGFITGFVGGAIAGGGVKLMWYCVSDKLFTPKVTVLCLGQGATYSFTTNTVPVGCLDITPAADVPSIGGLGLVPNKGKAALHSSVTADINWLLGFY